MRGIEIDYSELGRELVSLSKKDQADFLHGYLSELNKKCEGNKEAHFSDIGTHLCGSVLGYAKKYLPYIWEGK